MAQVVWSEPALSDLDAIAEYISLDKPSAAANLVRKVFSSTDKLEKFPELGRKPPEFIKSNYLEIIENPCRIFYRIEGDTVFIIYVMRSERRLRKYLLDARKNS